MDTTASCSVPVLIQLLLILNAPIDRDEVDLGGWLYAEMVYPPADGHPSKY